MTVIGFMAGNSFLLHSLKLICSDNAIRYREHSLVHCQHSNAKGVMASYRSFTDY